MPSIRQDAWTHAEDVELADIILRHIKEGSTQLAGFTEAGNRLSRTPAACGFRWNSAIRKINEEALKKAKTIRKQNKNEMKKVLNQTKQEDPTFSVTTLDQVSHVPISEPDIDQMISFLGELKKQSNRADSQIVNEQLKSLQIENRLLDEAYQKLQKDYSRVKSNYESLLDVLKVVDQARKEFPSIKESVR
jgi:prespore-specific regulator